MNTRSPNSAPFTGWNLPDTHPSSEGARAEEKAGPHVCRNFEETLRASEAERARIAKEVAEIKSDQQNLLERYVRLEEQNATLTTLFVACQRLHSTLERAEVLLTVREIIANLIGCEEFALLTRLPGGGLGRLDSWGLPAGAFEYLPPGSGLIWRTVETGEAYLRGESDSSRATRAEANLTACIPLKCDGAVTGVIALFRFLPQKFEIQELDRELFRLLETHVALALYCAELHEKARSRDGDAA